MAKEHKIRVVVANLWLPISTLQDIEKVEKILNA